MGKSSHNYVVAGPTFDSLLAFFQADGTHAFIFQGQQGYMSICDDNDDEADLDVVTKLASELNALVFLVQLFDSSVFVATLYSKGTALDEYIDYPQRLWGRTTGETILELNRDMTPEQRAKEWQDLFGPRVETSALAQLFRHRDEYVFAEDFHLAVLESLGLPADLVGATYLEVERAYLEDPEARNVFRYTHEHITDD